MIVIQTTVMIMMALVSLLVDPQQNTLWVTSANAIIDDDDSDTDDSDDYDGTSFATG